MEAVAFARWTAWRRMPFGRAARRLKLKGPTLAAWVRGWRRDRLALAPRGRSLKETDPITKDCIRALYYLAGPGIGLPTLQSLFPGVPRQELEEMLRRLRQSDLHKQGYWVHTLRWNKSGTVWAVDHLDAPNPIEGEYRHILAVRDLASGLQLLALPVRTKEMSEVALALKALFAQYGPPLVLKADNAFGAREVLDLLEEYRVQPLLSPPAYPKYNGAIEAGIGSLQTRAHHEAARHERPGYWTCDDVEAARRQANELARPWGALGTSPSLAWQERRPVKDDERRAFAGQVAEHFPHARQELGLELLPGIERSMRETQAVQRVSVGRALIQHGYLSVRRRRFTPPIKRSLWSKIS